MVVRLAGAWVEYGFWLEDLACMLSYSAASFHDTHVACSTGFLYRHESIYGMSHQYGVPDVSSEHLYIPSALRLFLQAVQDSVSTSKAFL